SPSCAGAASCATRRCASPRHSCARASRSSIAASTSPTRRSSRELASAAMERLATRRGFGHDRIVRPFGRLLSFAAALALWCTSGCATPGYWTDYTTVSVGKAAGGRIHRPVEMPRKGVGYEVPQAWRDRGNQWGTDELIGAVQRAAAQVRATRHRATLGVADLSPKRGGKTIWHASHQSGRDVDLIFYTVDARGRPLPPPKVEMVHFDGDGEPFVPRHMQSTGYEEPTWAERRF